MFLSTTIIHESTSNISPSHPAKLPWNLPWKCFRRKQIKTSHERNFGLGRRAGKKTQSFTYQIFTFIRMCGFSCLSSLWGRGENVFLLADTEDSVWRRVLVMRLVINRTSWLRLPFCLQNFLLSLVIACKRRKSMKIRRFGSLFIYPLMGNNKESCSDNLNLIGVSLFAQHKLDRAGASLFTKWMKNTQNLLFRLLLLATVQVTVARLAVFITFYSATLITEHCPKSFSFRSISICNWNLVR